MSEAGKGWMRRDGPSVGQARPLRYCLRGCSPPPIGGCNRWSISQIKLDRRNCRTQSDRQIGQIANSIGAFGSTNPLLVSEDGTLIAGEGRFDPSWVDASAVRKLGGATLQALRSSCRLSNGGRHA